MTDKSIKLYDNHGDEMNREKTKQIVTGAFMAALLECYQLLNVYTGRCLILFLLSNDSCVSLLYVLS